MPAGTPGRIETIHGAPVYFEVLGAGDPVVLLHGFTGSSQDWAGVAAEWSNEFQLIVPDLPGHGRSGILTKPFRHRDAALDMLALLDRLRVGACRAVGVSGGGNVLLHMASMQPDRVKAMVLVSATPYFPAQARAIMRRYADTLPEEQREYLRRRHPGGDEQIGALLDSAAAFAGSHDDLCFTPPLLATIQARDDTLFAPCIDLPFAQTIGFKTNASGSFDKFSSIVVRRRRCSLTSLVEIPPPVKKPNKSHQMPDDATAPGAPATSPPQ